MRFARLLHRHSGNSAVRTGAYAAGAVLALAAVAATLAPAGERFHAKGPQNTGHEALGCRECHTPAPGTVRQQLQAKVHHQLGWRRTTASFGHEPVGNAQCLSCHARDQDAHPVHRFLEPRFAEARRTFGVAECVSCHREHEGVRATVAPTVCAACHAGMELKRDPLDVSHRHLASAGQWATCLGCHDFHGNHRRRAQTRIADAYSAAAIADYLAGGPSPYGSDVKFKAKGAP